MIIQSDEYGYPEWRVWLSRVKSMIIQSDEYDYPEWRVWLDKHTLHSG